MTKMLIDRATVEQALEAMQIAAAELDSPYTSETPEERVLRAAITALKAALAEQQEQSEPDSPARRCGGPGCDLKCCQPVQENKDA